MKRTVLCMSLILSLSLTVRAGDVSGGNSVLFLDNGRDFYKELSSAIGKASSYICIEYFSVGEDSTSTAILDLLQKKAQSGVAVYALIDDYGSRHRACPMTDSTLEKYRAAGLDIAIFNKYNAGTPLPRDHRKLAVIDGVTAFVGGMNINDWYVHPSVELGPIRDFTLRLDGPVASALAEDFVKIWNVWAKRGKLVLPEVPEVPAKGRIDVSVIPTDGLEHNPTVAQNYRALIKSAKSSIVIANAYPIPSAPVITALKNAAGRGVKIDIFIGERTDLPEMLKKRQDRILLKLSKTEKINVHVLAGSFVHGKVISVDSQTIMVGSANLDYLSRTTNLELCVRFVDPETASRFERAMFLITN